MSVLFDNRIELDELALMILAIIDQFGEFLADSLDVVETRKGHITVQISGGRTWVNGEDLHRGIGLLVLNRHHTHHGILRSLAGNVSQGMPVWTDL